MKKRHYLIAFVCLFMNTHLFSQDTKFSKEALEDTFLNLEGDTITFENILQKYKGNVVFLDIWASWCRDCIVGMPKVKKLTKKYPNIKFVYLSLDKGLSNWKKGIEKYKLEQGAHYYAPNGWESAIFTAINLDWIPRYMLIDEKGEILIHKAIKADDKKLRIKLTNIENR